MKLRPFSLPRKSTNPKHNDTPLSEGDTGNGRGKARDGTIEAASNQGVNAIMDILLAHGYFLYEDPHELKVMKPYPPLGILHISAYLKARGFEVGVFDATFKRLTDFETLIARERPAVVGLYTNLMTKFNVLKMIKICKQHDAVVILGGPEPPYYAAEYLKRGTDIVVKGEGELTLEALLPHLARQPRGDIGRGEALNALNGIFYMDDNGVLVETLERAAIKDLDALPWPDREAIDIPEYMRVWKEHHGRSSVSVIQARGCAYKCTWCSHSVFGDTHRRRSAENAADELLWIKERYNPDQVWYADDVFAVNPRWLFRYAEALRQRGLKLPFECTSRADRLNDEVVKTLADMGCYRLWNGSESGSQAVLDAMKRGVKAKDVQEKTYLLRRYGIETGMFIMLGYEGETIKALEETVEHLKIANPEIFLTTVAYPIKGTAFYRAVESRILADKSWDERSDRDLTVAGRYSRQFYSFATRWMVNEVGLHQAKTRGQLSLKRRLKMTVNAKIGRLGMLLTAREKENRGQLVTVPG